MSLDWWEYYDFRGRIKTLNDEITLLKEEIKKLSKQVADLKNDKQS